MIDLRGSGFRYLCIRFVKAAAHDIAQLADSFSTKDEAFHTALLSFSNQTTYGAERCMTKSTGCDQRPQALRRKNIRAYK